MNKLNNIKCGLLALTLALSATVTACGNNDVTVEVPETYAKLMEIGDYGLGDKEDGYKNKTKNEDGSITYVFTKKQYDTIMSQLTSRIEESMSKTDDFEHVTKITANEDYTYFTFVSDEDSLSFQDALMPTAYVMLGNVYSVFKGNPDAEINYEFVNKDTGKVIYSSESGEKITETTTTTPETTAKPKTTTAATTTTKKETTTEAETSAPDEPAEEKVENTYEHNEYYDIVETSSFQNSIGTTIVIHKVLAKKNVSVSATLLAYASDGSVIGKSSDDITLTEGKYNFFRYSFDGDVSSAQIQANAQAKKDSFMTGERNAVEMVQYNMSGDDLYVTFEQTGDELGSFAKFKLLFYKGDQIVDTEDGYFNIYAENLNGKGSTDVASIWVYGTDFDRIEYVYEP